MSLPIGSSVAHYRLERQLGSGGMGDVYLARDTRLDRLVAIKFLVAPADAQSRRRLQHEARAVAALDHPGIAAVYEVGSDPVAGDFIAMQYVEGETLAARLKRGRMRPDEALSVCSHIADALTAAHRRGIIHRDLKPQNVIITPSGAPKLLDFGVATHAPGTAAAANAMTASHVTDAHVVVGTPAYMSPEQVRNEPLDFRSDVFALGVVLYECLTGQRAFTGATAAETLGNVIHVEPPAVSSVAPDTGPALDSLCARMMAKIPSDRFQSAEEVLGAIRALTPTGRITTSNSLPMPAFRTSVVWSRSTTAVAVIAIGLLVYQYWPRGPALPVPTSEAARYFDVGVEAMRAGTYGTARSAFQEAIKVFSNYPQAYARLAEAHIGLDDERNAEKAALEANRLVRDRSRLSKEDQLRFEAASASASRRYSEAIAAYRELADLNKNDSGRWLDVGRAEEAASHLPDALEAYGKAVSLDPESAAARLRLGILVTRVRKTAEGLASLDKAINIYHAVTNAEGEADALLAKGRALRGLGRANEARESLDDVVRRSIDPRFAAQRVSAQIELAMLDYTAGQVTSAESMAARAIEDALKADLPTVAARGLISLAVVTKNPAASDAHLVRAAELANVNGAKRIEMRARLQQASLRLRTGEPDKALSLAEGPEQYAMKAGERRLLADAELVKARAYEDRDRIDEARRLTEDAATIATETKDDPLLATALENLAGQNYKLSRYPEALAHRQRLEALHRTLNNQSALAADLTERAELLVLLGRRAEALALLDEIDGHIAKGEEPFVPQRAYALLYRALLATTEERWTDVLRAVTGIKAALAKTTTTGPPPYSQLFSRVLEEHARAHLGQSRVAAAAVARWPVETSRPIDRRQFSFWAAHTLIVRGDFELARGVAASALEDKSVLSNVELAWRIQAAAAEAARHGAGARDDATLATQARTSLDQLKTAWVGAADAYLARPDLVSLLKTMR